MSESLKICPICGASNPRSGLRCTNCGTSLTDVEPTQPTTPHGKRSPAARYDYRYGETDLYEGNLQRTGQAYLAGLLTLAMLGLIVGLVLILSPRLIGSVETLFAAPDTATPRPTLNIPTVTQGPPTASPTASSTPMPTATPTPTPEPCYQIVQSGDTLYSVVARCGYTTFDSIFEIVQATNAINDPAFIVLGQEIEIPWPSATPDPGSLPTVPPEQTGEASAGQVIAAAPAATAEGAEDASAFDENFDPLFIPTATLQPGLQFHTVQEGETIVSIGGLYRADVEILSQLNPEIQFSQCDFGVPTGGPRCQVFLQIGDLVRVPAPTLAPTLSPTPNGSETPTPTPTPTFNAPNALSPDDRALFRRTQLITLRWMGTGTLGEGQTYRVRVEDTTAGIVYTIDTISTTFVIPEDWQGRSANRHIYTWSVSVIDRDRPDTPLFTTEPRSFTWEGRDN